MWDFIALFSGYSEHNGSLSHLVLLYTEYTFIETKFNIKNFIADLRRKPLAVELSHPQEQLHIFLGDRTPKLSIIYMFQRIFLIFVSSLRVLYMF